MRPPPVGDENTPNPLIYRFDDNFGKAITITFLWDAVTKDVLGASVQRDANCQWRKIYIGLGPDGRPNSTEKVFNVGNFEGTVEFSQSELRRPRVDLRVIKDVTDLQITAGP